MQIKISSSKLCFENKIFSLNSKIYEISRSQSQLQDLIKIQPGETNIEIQNPSDKNAAITFDVITPLGVTTMATVTLPEGILGYKVEIPGNNGIGGTGKLAIPVFPGTTNVVINTPDPNDPNNAPTPFPWLPKEINGSNAKIVIVNPSNEEVKVKIQGLNNF